MKSIIVICIGLLFAGSEVAAQDKAVFKRKYVNHTEFGGLFGRVKYGGSIGNAEATENRQSITAQMFQGIKLSNSLTTGVTIGMDWYKTALINPVAIGARYDLTRGRVARLYATADAGYGFAWFHDDTDGFNTKGGLMVNPGLGLKYGKPDGAAFTIGLSWKRQEVNVDKPVWNNQEERYEERIYNRLALRLGMAF